MTDFQRWQIEQQMMNLRDELAYQQTQLRQSIASSMIEAQAVICVPPGTVAELVYKPRITQCFTDRLPRKPKIINCPNCGAPVTKFHCDYCGTKFD